MPQTESERLKSGRHQQQQGEEADARTQPKDSVSPQLYARTSVTQCHSEEEGRPFLQQVSRCSQLSQHRPSVLRQGVQAAHVRPKAPRTLTEASSAQPISLCKVKVDAGRQSSPPHSEPSPGPTRHPSPLRAASPKHSSIITRHHEPDHPTLRGSSALFLNGLCCWPGCNAVFEGFPRFLKHLHSDHGHGDRSIAQWRVQQDMVQYMETQLTVEKQKLFAMQLHLHLSGHKSTVLKAGSDWPYSHSLPLGLPQNPTPAQAPDGVPCCATKEPEDWPFAASYHLRPDLVPSVECYKYNNIRPPYTYAYLIRWSILESPDKQRSLNDIYNWFTTMFFYFRHNTATWKNAVRHNLSLHKCFERVEGGKGAVWTVDEMEYQRRKGQKYHRDHHVKWLAPYSLFSPEEL